MDASWVLFPDLVPSDPCSAFRALPLSKPLLRRVQFCVEALDRTPAASLPEIFAPTDYVACSRMLNNPRMHEAPLFDALARETAVQVAAEPLVVVVHDTTSFSFPGEVLRRGLGRLKSKDQGFLAHVALAVRPDDTRWVFGLAHLEAYVRTEAPARALPREVRETRESHEGLRWGRGVTAASRALGAVEQIHVMDREGDAYGPLAQMCRALQRFVVRQRQARRVTEPGVVPSPRRACPTSTMRVHASAVHTTLQVPLQPRATPKEPKRRKEHPGRAARMATVELRATAVHLARPSGADERLPVSLPVNVVEVLERDPPAGEEPVHWVLLTSEPIGTASEVERVVRLYGQRWIVEEFFKALKTGCSFEARQVESYEALLVLLALLIPSATRLLNYRSVAHAAPQRPAEQIADADTLALLRASPRARLPEHATAQQLLLAIAALGGHRPSNGPPGWLLLYRGLRALEQQRVGYRVAREAKPPDATPIRVHS